MPYTAHQPQRLQRFSSAPLAASMFSAVPRAPGPMLTDRTSPSFSTARAIRLAQRFVARRVGFRVAKAAATASDRAAASIGAFISAPRQTGVDLLGPSRSRHCALRYSVRKGQVAQILSFDASFQGHGERGVNSMSAEIYYLHARPAPRHRINWTKAGWLLFAVAWCLVWWWGLASFAHAVARWLLP